MPRDPNTVEFAFDKSVRTYDADGKLHVSRAHVTKAAVNPYRGNEIIGWQELGLEPNRIYHLLRDPDELAKGAQTFNRCPVLDKHVPFNVETYDEADIAGWLGSDASWTPPYVDASITFVKPSAIAGIENDVQRELSASYRYKSDMTPGTYNGLRYDGIMRDIRANHVALVEAGRAGPDVVVEDAETEFHQMAKSPALTSRTALMLNGALISHLTPIVAADAKLDLFPLLKDINRKNFRARKPKLVAGLRALAAPHVAQDADLDSVIELLDKLGPLENGDPDQDDITADSDDVMSMDNEGLREFLKGKLSDEDHAKACSMMAPKAADGEPEDLKGKDKDPPAKDRMAKDGGPEPKPGEKPMDKPAMDAALKRQRGELLGEFQAIRIAEAAVRPYIGDVVPDLAHDSAASIYALALEQLGVDIDGVHPSAYPALLKAQPVPGEKPATTPRLAMDAALRTRLSKRFPNATKVRAL